MQKLVLWPTVLVYASGSLPGIFSFVVWEGRLGKASFTYDWGRMGWGMRGGEVINQTENNQKGIKGGREAKKSTFFMMYDS